MRSSSSSSVGAASARLASRRLTRSRSSSARGPRLGEARLEPADALQQPASGAAAAASARLASRPLMRSLSSAPRADVTPRRGSARGGRCARAAPRPRRRTRRRGLLEAGDAREQLLALGGVLGRRHLVAGALELLARLVDLPLGLFGAVAAGLRLTAGLLERGGEVSGGSRGPRCAPARTAGGRRRRQRRRGRRSNRPGCRDRDRGAPRPRCRPPRVRTRGGRAPLDPRVGWVGRNATSVPAVRQPSHGCGSASSAWRNARTTTGCCWRMRISIRLRGSSKERSSRKSEKSKPSSSLTGMKTISSGNERLSAA